MQRGESFGLCPGGFPELAGMVRGRDAVYLKNKGFIKFALRFGYKVVPCYTFGEVQTYWNVEGCEALRERLAQYGVPGILVTGPFTMVPLLALLPFSKGVGLHTIHGTGVQFPQIVDPTREDVDNYHRVYCDSLRALFDRHRKRFGIEGELEMFI